MPQATITLTWPNNDVNNGLNNVKRITSTTGGYNLKNCEVALRSATVNYSFPTFKTATFFKYIWPSDGLTYNVPIPANFYGSLDDMSNILHSVMLTNGHYLVNAVGNYVYYASMSGSQNYDATIITSPLVPTALPAGYSNPAGMTFPAVASNVQWVFSQPDILTTFGFDAGTYPSTPVTGINYNLISQHTPQLSPYSAILLWTDAVAEQQNTYPNQLYSFPINAEYGQNITVEPKNFVWIRASDIERKQSISVSLKDQTGNDLTVLDPNWTVELLIREIPVYSDNYKKPF